MLNGDRVSVQIYRSARPVRPLTPEQVAASSVERLFENSDKRVYWSGKPMKSDGERAQDFWVRTPNGAGGCTMKIGVRGAANESLVSEIARTLSVK